MSCCWATITLRQGIFSFSHHFTSEEAGDAQEAVIMIQRWRYDPKRPKGYGITLSIVIRRKVGQGSCSENWLGVSQWVVSNCIVLDYCNSFIITTTLSVSVLINWLFLNPQILLFFSHKNVLDWKQGPETDDSKLNTTKSFETNVLC